MNKAAEKFKEIIGDGVAKIHGDGEFVVEWANGYGNYEFWKNRYNGMVKSFEITRHDDNGFTYDKSMTAKKKAPVFFLYNGHTYCETFLEHLHEILGAIVAVEEWKVFGTVLNDDGEPEDRTMFVFVAINGAGDCMALADYEGRPDDWPVIEDDGGFDMDIKDEETVPLFRIEDIMDSTADPFGDF